MTESKDTQAPLSAKDLAALRQAYDFGDFGGAGNGGPTLSNEQAEALLHRLFDGYAAMLAERDRLERGLAEANERAGTHEAARTMLEHQSSDLVDALCKARAQLAAAQEALVVARGDAAHWCQQEMRAREQLAEARREVEALKVAGLELCTSIFSASRRAYQQVIGKSLVKELLTPTDWGAVKRESAALRALLTTPPAPSTGEKS
jgi:hypothetical protein